MTSVGTVIASRSQSLTSALDTKASNIAPRAFAAMGNMLSMNSETNTATVAMSSGWPSFADGLGTRSDH
jgi:hypothetical protein